MFKKLSRSDALHEISNWSTNDVLCMLRKNGLEECCNAIMKRQIDGDELLHLTEGKLALWKSDLTRPLMWNLWTFAEDIRKSPEKYVEGKILEQQGNEDHLSDTGSWGTDFEDEDGTLAETQRIVQSNSGFLNKTKLLRDSRRKYVRTEGISKQEEEGTYANCGSPQTDESTYANCQESTVLPSNTVSRSNSQAEKSLAEQLKEQLELRNTKKPLVGPKPEMLQAKRIEIAPLRSTPQKSFLHNVSKVKSNVPSQTQKRMNVPPPPEPRKNKDSTNVKKSNKDQIKPPATLRNLDLVANLPIQTEESEDEYEPFDEQIIEQNQKKNMSRVDSKQSLTSGHQSSVESVYQPPSVTSFEEDEEHYEIYESITETPDDNGYIVGPIQRPTSAEAPPPLPAKPPQSSASSPCQSLNRTVDKLKVKQKKKWKLDGGIRGATCCESRKKCRLHSNPKNKKSPAPTSHRHVCCKWLVSALEQPAVQCNCKRSPEKKSATLPHSSSNTSLSSERATRPLPPPPERQSYTDKPWFHNITREQATALIKEQSTYGNPLDGYFLLRPSTTNVNNPLALVLWYKDRVYNVPVRKRPDNRYALGSAKVNEQSFSSVEEIVMFYTREELLLHSGGVEMGSTKLTDTPPK